MAANSVGIEQAKRQARQQVWGRLEEHGVVELGVAGHIPAFTGAEAAAERLTSLPQWRAARVIKANPDRAQLPVRVRALTAGKTVYMAVPNMSGPRPFYRLDATNRSVPAEHSASSHGAATLAHTVDVEDIPPLDVVVCGSVAVNRDGARVGKGAGYSDIEVALLIDAGLVRAHTTIVTTVHSLQVVDGSLPEEAHDFRVDVVVTPEEIISCAPARRPPGVLWERLTADKIAAIPALARRMPARRIPRSAGPPEAVR